MKITQIKQQKDKNRVNVYLDGKFGFGIDLDNFVKLGLKIEQEITTEELEKIVDKSEFQKYLNKVVSFAMVRPRSSKEFKDWLKRKRVDEKYHKRLISKLESFDLIDDKKFATWWIEQRNHFRPRSKRALKQELFQKGISRDVIDEALSENTLDEVGIARGLINKYSVKWKRYEKAVAKKKKIEYLARKGFGWEVIKSVLDTKIDEDSYQ